MTILIGPVLKKSDQIFLLKHISVYLKKNKEITLIAVDGGLNWILKFSIIKFLKSRGVLKVNTLYVGDQDSYLGAIPKEFEILKLKKDKACSDLFVALNIVKKGSQVLAFGFSGGREDHFLAVLGDAKHVVEEKKLKLSILSQAGLIEYLTPFNPIRLNVKKSQIFSILDIWGQAKNIKITGAQYSYLKTKNEAVSYGLSNVATSNSLSVSVKEGTALFVLNSK